MVGYYKSCIRSAIEIKEFSAFYKLHHALAIGYSISIKDLIDCKSLEIKIFLIE
jgi:hypothetical protein